MAITRGSHNWSMYRDLGVLSPKWAIYITPFPFRDQELLQRRGRKIVRDRDKR